MSFKDSDLVVYKFCVINSFDGPLFEIHFKQTFLPFGGKKIILFWLFVVMCITGCSASESER